MRLFRITVCLLALTSPAFAAANPEFPIQGLERRVEFWKKVYTQYGENDVIIHDRIHPNLIYDVACGAIGGRRKPRWRLREGRVVTHGLEPWTSAV